jgi:hypothetical protein
MDKSGVYYHIHEDTAGVCETDGSADSRPCNWTRLAANWDHKQGIEDEYASFIGNGEVTAKEIARVTVKAGEYFVSYGCLPWRYVGHEEPQP